VGESQWMSEDFKLVFMAISLWCGLWLWLLWKRSSKLTLHTAQDVRNLDRLCHHCVASAFAPRISLGLAAG
jgi:hypothetical protein